MARGATVAPLDSGLARGLVVAVDLRDRKHPLEPELAEYEALIEAAGAQLVGRVVQRRDSVDPATLVGDGKAHELASIAEESGATMLFVFNDLRPRQRTNLAKIIPLPIVDRTMVILDIFAQRARSREGKLQVELAQLRHRQANLIGAGAALSRLGGGIGTRGPGETKLEVDRRRIQERISTLRAALEDVRRARATRRGSTDGEPLVALVGYTNAGKSSLLNRLSHLPRGAFVADQPFATLDPTLRRVYLAPDRFARVADTVGFITELPKDLVSAFRATLEELDEADVLVHVIDVSNPDWPRQRESVDEILHDLNVANKPTLLAFNKIDKRADLPDHVPQDGVAISATTGEGIDKLREGILESLDAQAVSV
jgi:GTP-binding protein HflX